MNGPQALSPDVQEALDRVSATVQKALTRIAPKDGDSGTDQQTEEAA